MTPTNPPMQEARTIEIDPHRNYGPCDGFGPGGQCSECAKARFNTSDAWDAWMSSGRTLLDPPMQEAEASGEIGVINPEHYERLATQFYEETGVDAPGKDIPSGSTAYGLRWRMWECWLIQNARLTTAESTISELRADKERLVFAGDRLATIAYNLAQRDELSARDRETLDTCRKQWDAARAQEGK